MPQKPEANVRNNFELFAWNELRKAGVEFEYEPFSIELAPAFSLKSLFVEHERKKGLSKKTNRVQNIKYTPDFVGKNWLMETKGLRRPGFDIRWKLFKKYLHDNNLNWLVLMPSTQGEVIQCIEMIQNHLKNDHNTSTDWGLLQIPPLIKQRPIRSTKSKTPKIKKRVSRSVRAGG